ncbi:acyl carrier protein [Roseateles oligotrophus]|uniref:Acyl carrier protein n=1 Tax=Roseateles oligotrophus TaxID=1769250 RepID=A0ABT2YIM7_9BURK|nr:acyl carrier protein [Roseateles oligotrophus]MCV2369920.1 acyl carrier protein [Roseateles oligotrophus]
MSDSDKDKKIPSRQDLTLTLLELLCQIAPEIDPKAIAIERPLRRQVDLDSMDWLNFLLGIEKRFGIAIPEADYAGLISLDDVLNYLQARMVQGKTTD